MNALCRSVCLCLWLELAPLSPVVAQAPATTSAPVPPPALEILNFKIGTDYYPMLDSKPSTMTADNPDFPRPPNEEAARRNRRGGFGERNEEIKARGKSRSRLQIISEAQWVQLSLKNTGSKMIKALAWDFAFVRKEEGKLLLRYEAFHQVEIKPGSKKNLKQPLPPGATRCQVFKVSADTTAQDKAKAFEAVCGRGVNDPSQLPEQKSVIIRRIEYADGTVWSQP